ncbi:MAG: MXAN_6640 family putative metalloprotease [Ignavibacteriaceae bacterium]
MKKNILIIFLISATAIFAQEYSRSSLDSLYNTYIGLREGNTVNQTTAQGGQNMVQEEHGKCGFGLVNIIRMNLKLFSPDQQAKLQKILQRPATDTSIVSPKGYFRIHFYKPGGSNPPPAYDVNQFAIAADSAYDFEVGYLGYPAPPGDAAIDGENKYDIYIDNLGSLYGQTNFDTEIVSGSNRYYSYMEIDDDFAGFYTTGINAAKVTVAHEFHHGIQIGNYIYRDTDIFFYELTSTAMETFVYPSIPDYFQYLPSYFSQSSLGFAGQSGYNMAIWDIYLKMNYGYAIIKREWELMPSQNALAAVNSSLVEKGSSFAKAFQDFGVWTYYTNYRTKVGMYFLDAAKYPLMSTISSVAFTPPSKVVQVNTKPATNNFISFTNQANGDTLIVQISNIDYQTAISNPGSTESFTYSLFNDLSSGSIKISNKYSANLSVSKSSSWLSSEFLNNVLVNNDTTVNPPVLTEIQYAYPNPFIYNKTGSIIYIPVSSNNTGSADLNIYSSSMNLVYTSILGVFNNVGHPVVSWNGRSNSNQKLASGVYVYITKAGGNVIKGKLVIFNE